MNVGRDFAFNKVFFVYDVLAMLKEGLSVVINQFFETKIKE